jgi:hypothetical protein
MLVSARKRGDDVAEPVRLTRKELYEKVWSQPVRTLAKEFGISDVGLKKTCKRHDIPTPGVGYWAKVEHGKTVRREKLPPAKRGESDIIVIKAEAAYHPWQVSAEATPDWVERESLPDYRVKSNRAGGHSSVAPPVPVRNGKSPTSRCAGPDNSCSRSRLTRG